MKSSVRIAILAVVLVAVAAIVVSKYRDRPEAATPAATVTTPAEAPSAASAAPAAAPASVLLFADLREADEEKDRCGMIIRAVRAMRQHGVNVTEYDSGASPDVRKQHRVVVEPTVIVLDASGREVARHEGEDDATMQAIRDEMARLSGGRA